MNPHRIDRFDCRSADGKGSDMTICRHPPPYESTFSAILLPARRELLLAPGYACCHAFVRRSLDHNGRT